MMKKYTGMSKIMQIVSVIALAVLFVNCGFISVTYAMTCNSASSEVVVTVVCGDIDEATLASIEFDDGTRLQDYDYTVELVEFPENLTQRGSTIPLETFFDSVAWVQRSDGVTLSLDPTDDVRSSPSMWGSAWAILVSNCGTDLYWDNEQVMRWQFDCHANFANTKETWNIEPWRTASNYAAVVLAGCNP